MAVALLALVVALTGTSYAALKVSGKDIQKGSIPGNRLKQDGVTGRQVNEAQLGPVPRAQEADKLGGLSPGSFLGMGSKAADADLLDGLDSTGFVNGGGSVDGQVVDAAVNTTVFVGPALGGLIRFRYTCPITVGGNGTLRIINSSAGVANTFIDSGGASPDYVAVAAGNFVDYPAAAGGDSFVVQMQGTPGVVVATVGTVHRNATNDCRVQVLALLAG